MYVEKLTIENFKCFERAELELNYPGRAATATRPVPQRLKNVNLLLGGNGSGKSSVFKALPIAVIGPVLLSGGFQADYLKRRIRLDSGVSDLQRGKINFTTLAAELSLSSIDIGGNDFEITPGKVATSIVQIGDLEHLIAMQKDESKYALLFTNRSPAFFLAGYGANRRSEQPQGYSESSRSPRYQRVASLFEDHVGLIPFTYGFLQLHLLNRFTEAVEMLNSLMPDGVFLTEQTDGLSRPLFERGGISLPFNALSDGFRTFVGWVWDLLYQMTVAQPQKGTAIPFKEMTGVCIVDEIDLFLHPEWQRVVIEQVAKTFPKLQFLFSTHSPLVAGTLEPENIFVMEQEADGTATVRQYQENIYGLTANQVLTSSYFGLHSTRAPGAGTLTENEDKAIAARAKGDAGNPEPLAEAQKQILDRLMTQADRYEDIIRGTKGAKGGRKK